MTIYEIVIATYPELVHDPRIFQTQIVIQDDSDGVGEYLAKWDCELPIPDGLHVGKPA